MKTCNKRLLAYYVTTAVLDYFRFKRRCLFIATEVGVYNSDILCINDKDVISEIEVKVSLSDLRNDLKKAYTRYGHTYKKHEVYNNPRSKSIWIPHRFYFAVPDKLVANASEIVAEQYPQAGLVSVNTEDLACVKHMDNLCAIARRGHPLHNRSGVPDKLRSSILLRMGSESITNRQRIIKYKEAIHDK